MEKVLIKKYTYPVLGIIIVYTAIMIILGYFNIGLLSDDYLNVYDATTSSLSAKFAGKLAFTNELHFRPAYYFSLEKSEMLRKALGFDFDNFLVYRIQNLFLFFVLAYLVGLVILIKSKRVTISIVASLSVLIFPSNLHNVCWTAARVDLLCGVFYFFTILFIFLYVEKQDTFKIVLASFALILGLMTKETAVTIPVIGLMLVLFHYGLRIAGERKGMFITLFAILFLYFIYRLLFMGNDLANALLYYHPVKGFKAFFSTIPPVTAKSIISLTIPLDYLTLSMALLNKETLLILYLVILYGTIFYITFTLIKGDANKFLMQLMVLFAVVIMPYILVGYIRPQMILIPFCIILIQMSFIYINQTSYSIYLNKKFVSIAFLLTLIFWSYWSCGIIQDWKLSYSNAGESMNNLLTQNINENRYTVIIGNHGRIKQSLLFDKLTGAYNFWKYRDFIIKDTINDIVQTGAIDEESLLAELKITNLQTGEYEIKATGATQFFYMEGFDTERMKTGFKNDYMSVEFSEFSFLNKPKKVNLKILSVQTDCFIANGLKFYKLN